MLACMDLRLSNSKYSMQALLMFRKGIVLFPLGILEIIQDVNLVHQMVIWEQNKYSFLK